MSKSKEFKAGLYQNTLTTALKLIEVEFTATTTKGDTKELLQRHVDHQGIQDAITNGMVKYVGIGAEKDNSEQEAKEAAAKAKAEKEAAEAKKAQEEADAAKALAEKEAAEAEQAAKDAAEAQKIADEEAAQSFTANEEVAEVKEKKSRKKSKKQD